MTQLGKYELLEKIGEGGFGIVYKALDPQLQRDVAIKVLRSDLASAPDFVERFQREARLAAGLHHSNIVTVYEIGEQEGRNYIVMEHLLGQSLAGLLQEGKPLPLAQALNILRPLAQALDYAHRKGVIHRDIKPSNVILAADERPVLTDFGLVKSMIEQGTTTTGITLGTPEYMAPEQITGQNTGSASDLYALGVIAFQMLTGRVPFTGRTPFEIQMGHVQQAPPPPRSLNPAMPEALAQVLLRALAKNPLQRYQTGAELVAALELFLPRPVQPADAVHPVIPATAVVPLKPAVSPVEQTANLAQPAAPKAGKPKNTLGTLLTLGVGLTLAALFWIGWAIATSAIGLGFSLPYGILAFLITFILTILVARRVWHRQRIPWLAILAFVLGMILTLVIGSLIGLIVSVVITELITHDPGTDSVVSAFVFSFSWLICSAFFIALTTTLWRRVK